MENQTKRDVERGLLLKLRETVNSQEELDWVEAELARLEAEEPTCGTDGHTIDTVAEAVACLEQRGFAVVQVQTLPALWEVACREDAFSGTYTESEVVQMARGEQALHLMRSQAGVNSLASSHAEQRGEKPAPITTVADAVGFLAERCHLLGVQVEIDPTLWKVVSLDGEFEALFTEAALMDFAHDERDSVKADVLPGDLLLTPAAPQGLPRRRAQRRAEVIEGCGASLEIRLAEAPKVSTLVAPDTLVGPSSGAALAVEVGLLLESAVMAI